MTACQTIDATGERQLSFIGSQQEIEMGKSSNEDIVKAMGLYRDESLQHYVQQLGLRIAATTERPELPWTFQVIDDDTVNAFAVPGGYIYLTRGILAHFENEAQLAGVLGHEIAHVTAKHSIIRMSKNMVTQLGLGIATIAVPELREFSSMLGQGVQLLFLKFSRDDETEADKLGIRYMLNVNENPQELVDVMAMLGRLSMTTEGGRLPQWASTHPLPANRMDYIQSRINELPAATYEPVDRNGYLRRLDGLTYGEDPRQGFTRDSTYYHPDMDFQISFPKRWRVLNQRSAVLAVSPQKDAAFQITLAENVDPRQALRTFFSRSNLVGMSASHGNRNGIPFASGQFRSQTRQGIIYGLATFFNYNQKLYQVVGYTDQRNWGTYQPRITDTAASFKRLQNRQFREVEPLRVKIIQTSTSRSLKDIHAGYNMAIPLEELARLNQVDESEIIEAGTMVKIVEGRLP